MHPVSLFAGYLLPARSSFQRFCATLDEPSPEMTDLLRWFEGAVPKDKPSPRKTGPAQVRK